MTSIKSTRSPRSKKAQKPIVPKGFPLTVNPCGQFSKKRRGKVYYFGPHHDTKAALAKFNHSWSFILAGQPVPPMGQDVLTVQEVCSQFLESCENKVNADERSRETLRGYNFESKKWPR